METPDSDQLPHLLRLLDDDTEGVRRAVANALNAYGPGLSQALAQLSKLQ